MFEQASQVYDSVTAGLQEFYRTKLLPIEKDHLFHQFYSPELTDAKQNSFRNQSRSEGVFHLSISLSAEDADFASAPMILLMGQYSTG